LIPLFFSK